MHLSAYLLLLPSLWAFQFRINQRQATEERISSLTRRNARNSEAPLVMFLRESDFPGAGVPRPDLDPAEIPTLLFNALVNNDFPSIDDGLKSVWAFSGDTNRHIFQHNVTDFNESAHKTALEFPISFDGNAFFGCEWSMETDLNLVGNAETA